MPTKLPRIAIALEYPLAQQGGTEVLVKCLVRGLSKYFEIILISGEKTQSQLPIEVLDWVALHLPWDLTTPDASSARQLAGALRRQKVLLAHFHFGGTFSWQS